REKESCHEGLAEERGRGEVMHLAANDGANEERVDEVVRMIDAEEHRSRRGHVLGMVHVDGLEEEPQPELRDRAHAAVEAIHTVRSHAVESRSCSSDCRISSTPTRISCVAAAS